MNISKSVALLKACLDQVPRLKSLAYNPKNQELMQWDGEVKRIIIDTFGRDSKEYARFNGIPILKRVNTQEEREQAYIASVSQYEAALKDIIKEHEMPTKTEDHTSGRGISKAELELFYDGFVRYRELVLKKQREGLTGVEESEFQTLSSELQRKYGKFQKVIKEYGGSSELLLQGGKYKCEALSSAFNYTMFGPGALKAVLDKAIATINMAIGNLEKPLVPEQLQQKEDGVNITDPKKVFVVHGRNEEARVAMFTFLRSVGLEPIEWSEAVRLTGKATPYIGEVLDVVFSQAQAIVVLFTGDDLTRLGNRFTAKGEKDEQLTPQARPNVIFESGLAFGRNPDRTVLVQLGDNREISDLAGRHTIRMDDSLRKRQEFASRLKSAGCSVQIEHRTDWHKAGEFNKAIVKPDTLETSQQPASGDGQPKTKSQGLIIKQVNELRTNLANALQANDPILERTYRIEYIKLLHSAVAQWNKDRTILNQLLLLKAEAAGFDIKLLKSDKLATIKWVLNSAEKMLTILQT